MMRVRLAPRIAQTAKRWLRTIAGRRRRASGRIAPRRLRIEASSFCQLRCPSCPTTTGAIHPAIGSGFLRLDDFEKLLASAPTLEHVELSNYGEVFLNPQLLPILRLAHERNVAVSILNGANLNNVSDEVLEGLVTSQVREMSCSIDGASPETYARYRVRGNFETVIGNIEKINAYKRRHQSMYPRLRWQFVVFGHNEHEIPVARRMAEALDMEFCTKLTWDDDFSPIRDRELVGREIGSSRLTRTEYEADGGIYGSYICSQLWDEPQVNWDGKVVGCCRNFWGDFGGNAFRDGVIESVNHEKMVYARQMLTGRKPPRDDIPCTTCDIYMKMRDASRFLH